MKQPLHTIILAGILVFLLSLSMHAQEQSSRIYDNDHPLVYEDAFDLWPYAFKDEYDEEKGFNVDLIKILLDKLNIPYIIVLKNRQSVLDDLRNGTADLTLGLESTFHDTYGKFSKSTVLLFTHSVARPKKQPVNVRTMQDLAHQQVIVHKNSYSDHVMREKGWGHNAIPWNDMNEAIHKVSKDENGQIVWNTGSLKWLIYNNKLDNMQLTPIDMPHGEYKFMSNDQHLLDLLDKAYADLSSAEGLESIKNKWFYPEKTETGIPSWIWYLTGLIGMVVMALIYYRASIRTREQEAIELTRVRNNRLSLILQASHVKIWLYDVGQQTFTWLDRNGKPTRKYTSLEFARIYHPEDFRMLGESLRKLAKNEEDTITLELKSYENEEKNSNDWRFYRVVLSVLRRKQGKPSVIIGTKSDITEEYEKQQQTKLQLMRYQSVFNTAMVDMVYFDENGNVVNMNERAKQSFNSTSEKAIANKVNIYDCLQEPTFSKGSLFYATQIKDNKYGIDYYERLLVPVYDHQGKMLGIYGTGRDVTEVATSYRKLHEGINKLQKANKHVTEYVDNINYVLGVGGVRIAYYSPKNHTLSIYQNLNTVQQSLTQTRCMTLVDEKYKKTAMRALNNLDNLTSNTVDAEIKTTIRLKGRPLYLHFRFIPVYDEEGHVTSYFGMCRDLSEMKATEALLEKETIKAREVEYLKNSFLRNMSYEIRTPLTGVVGFAELFEMDHDSADEEVFIREIKNNSAFLLNLINDILFLSRLDAHMIEINRQPTDFANTFEGHCQIGWSNYIKEGVNYIVENPYEKLIVDIDDANVGRVIEQITINAAQHTTQGSIRARYNYVAGSLIILVDDTGEGMNKDTLNNIYERFNSSNHHGTGLGIPICKELLEQMDGSIEISSEEGKGTTVWIIIPCKAYDIVRK